jgi:hypothetical protein
VALQRHGKGFRSPECGVRRCLGDSTGPNGTLEDEGTLGMSQGQIGLLQARLPAISTTVTRP